MTEVYLHGILAKKFKQKYTFDISKPEDLMVAIDSNSPNFLIFLRNNFDTLSMSVLVDKKVMSPDVSSFKRGFSPKRIDLVPALSGGLGFLGWFIIGLFASATIAYLFAANSVAPPEMDNNSEQSVKTRSFEFAGEVNLEKQGKPVPVGYGRLRVGSYVIGSQVWNRNLFNQVKSADASKSAASSYDDDEDDD